MLDVDADFYNPQQDAKWLQAPDQGPAPSMVQRLQAALPNNLMQQAQAIQAPVMPQQKINIPMLDVDADFYNPQQDAKWLQAPDQGPAPSMSQRFQSALPSNPMQQAQSIQAPQIPAQPSRQPQSFEFTRNRLGLATLLDELEQNEAQAERRQAKASLVNNPAFVGPSGEQMEGIVQGRREKLADYLTQAAGAKAKGLNYLGDLGTVTQLSV